jgi:F-type H+-transporting ATPase subunit delta
MSSSGIALRYARALYDVAAADGSLDVVSGDVAALERILREAPQIKHFCLQERDDRGKELAVVEIAFLPYVGPRTARTIELAVRNGRIGILPYLPLAFRTIQERSSDTVRVLLEAAQEPQAELVAQVESTMRRRIGSAIRLDVQVVPELLGGMRIRWDNRVIDLSVASRLKQLRAWIKSA